MKKKVALGIILSILLIATPFSSAAIKPTRELLTKNGEFDEAIPAVDPVLQPNINTRSGLRSTNLGPTDDAQVVEGYQTSNYGDRTYLYVQSASAGASSYQDERAWAKFDMNDSIPDNASIISATLRLSCWRATGPDMDASAHGSTDDTWTESSITWNTQPVFDLELDRTPLITGETGVWKEWNVTSFVQSQWEDDKVVSFVVKPTVEDSATVKTFSFDSKEYSSGLAPTLRVEHTGDGGDEAWDEVSSSPQIYPYAVGVVGAGENIYIANSGYSNTDPQVLMRYNTTAGVWNVTPNPLYGPDEDTYQFKNAVAMDWDRGSYIYVLFGGSYSNCDGTKPHRYYFRRYNISSDTWEDLQNTSWYQGPGDALTWVTLGGNEYIYAFLGSSSRHANPHVEEYYPEGVQFWRYNVSSNTWDQNLTHISYGADDGADLVWTGGDYIYAFPGAYEEQLPKDEERHFFRYSVSGDSWVELENTPYNADGGIDDGGSLLYPGYGDYIYALKGGDDGAGGGGSPGDDFWRYSISNDSWEILPSIPAGVGDQNGHRLGLSDGKIYCWRGCFDDGTLWAYPLAVLLEGHCNYTSMTPVNTVSVDVINLDTGQKWQADTIDDYYSLELTPGEDINTGETLRLIATDDNSSVNVTDHPVTASEISVGLIHFDLILDVHYRDLKEFPMYPADPPDYNQMTGAAAAQMMLNYLVWNKSLDSGGPPTPPPYDDQDAIFDMAHENNTNTSLAYIDAGGMLGLLTGEIVDQGYGYHFFISHNDTQEGIALRICSWLDFNVSAWCDLKEGHPAHVPALIPAYGDYSQWMAVRGIHTNKNTDPYPDGPPDNVEVYGFWVNDPLPSGGIGENTYKTVDEFFLTYYSPLSVVDDPFDGQYVAVTEPPEDFDGALFDDAPLIFAASPATFSEQDARIVKRVGRRAMQARVMDDMVETVIFNAASDAAKDIAVFDRSLADMLKYAEPVKAVYVLCNDGSNYCIAVFGGEADTIAVRIGAIEGELLEISVSLEPPGEYLSKLGIMNTNGIAYAAYTKGDGSPFYPALPTL